MCLLSFMIFVSLLLYSVFFLLLFIQGRLNWIVSLCEMCYINTLALPPTVALSHISPSPPEGYGLSQTPSFFLHHLKNSTLPLLATIQVRLGLLRRSNNHSSCCSFTQKEAPGAKHYPCERINLFALWRNVLRGSVILCGLFWKLNWQQAASMTVDESVKGMPTKRWGCCLLLIVRKWHICNNKQQ